MDGHCDLSAAVAVRLWCVVSIRETGVEVCTCAEHTAMSGYDDGLYAGVETEEVESVDEVGSHGIGECIVVLWAVERY